MKLTVFVYRRPNMFEVADSLYNMLGYGELKNMFSIENYKTTHEKLMLYFPERFLNLLELRALISRCEQSGYKEVTIVTHSEHILTTVHHENIRIVQDELIPEDGRFKLSNDEVGMPSNEGLHVIHGN